MSSIAPAGDPFNDPGTVVRLVRECNEYTARLAVDYPGRFGLMAALPLPNIDASLKEIEYAFDTLKADGLGLFTVYRRLVVAETGKPVATVTVMSPSEGVLIVNSPGTSRLMSQGSGLRAARRRSLASRTRNMASFVGPASRRSLTSDQQFFPSS